MTKSWISIIWGYVKAILVATFFLLTFNFILGSLLVSNTETGSQLNIAQFGQFIQESGIGAWNYLFIVLFSVAATHMLYYLYNRYIAKRELTAFALRDINNDILIGLIVGFLIFSVIYLLALITGIAKITGFNGPSVLILPLAIGIQAGYSEELVFRNILYRRVWKIHGHIMALVVTAIPFGILHLLNPGATILGTLNIIVTGGIIFGVSYALTKRIWLPIFLHISWNFVQGGIYGIKVSGISVDGLIETELSGPILLSGGEFGLEASIITTIILLPISIMGLYMLFNQDKVPPWKIFRQEEQIIMN